MKEQATQWDGALLAHQGRTCSACSAAMEPCCHVCSLSRPAKSSTLHLGHLLLCRQQECIPGGRGPPAGPTRVGPTPCPGRTGDMGMPIETPRCWGDCCQCCCWPPGMPACGLGYVVPRQDLQLSVQAQHLLRRRGALTPENLVVADGQRPHSAPSIQLDAGSLVR